MILIFKIVGWLGSKSSDFLVYEVSSAACIFSYTILFRSKGLSRNYFISILSLNIPKTALVFIGSILIFIRSILVPIRSVILLEVFIVSLFPYSFVFHSFIILNFWLGLEFPFLISKASLFRRFNNISSIS